VPLSYREALDALVATGSQGIKAGLERITALLAEVGDPQQGLRGALVAGTNGKGSVAAMIESACRAAGLSTVLLVKPHLVSYRERFVIDGRPIDEATFARLMDRLLPVTKAVERRAGAPTQFELLTALGVLAARDRNPDVVVCEVGLGGRLDSTNVLDLGVAVITNVALDHQDMLGDTVEQVAREKAGIIKPGDDVVTGAASPALEVIEAHADAVHPRRMLRVGKELGVTAESRGHEGIAAEVSYPGGALSLRVPLPGLFQAANAAVAAGACVALRERGLPLSDDAIRRGLAAVSWPGRLEWLAGQPALLLDGAHNPAAVAAMVPAVRELCGERPLCILFGAMRDKDAAGMLHHLRGLGAPPVFTQAGTPRALPATELARLWGPGARAVADLPDAVLAARLLAGREGVVLVCGSIYVVGDVLQVLGRDRLGEAVAGSVGRG
jgi:dihydrofolate synthase/folylpolyglutamate synthase